MTRVLDIDDVSFRYKPSSDRILNGLSYSFKSGEVTAITGPSGSGKSTLLYILGLMLKPASGRVLLNNLEVSSMKDSKRSAIRNSTLGFVFQDAALDPVRAVIDSVVEPAIYSSDNRAEAVTRARMLLDEVGVGLRADHKPGEISGGQAQRVAVCRALINRPSVILADEPTGNLDEENRNLVFELLSREAHLRGRAVIIATHDRALVDRADSVLEIANP